MANRQHAPSQFDVSASSIQPIALSPAKGTLLRVGRCGRGRGAGGLAATLGGITSDVLATSVTVAMSPNTSAKLTEVVHVLIAS